MVEPVLLLGQPLDETGDRPGGALGQSGADDAYGERQLAAGGYQCGGGLRLGGDTVRADDPRHERQRLLGREDIQLESVRRRQ